jgi:MFS family permease
VLDRLGVGRGLTLAISWWSIAGMLTSLARGPLSLGFFRSLLAIGEGGAWPAFAKAVAIWVPPEARTLAIGICNSGSSLGAMIAPPLVAWVTYRSHWRTAFIAAFLGCALPETWRCSQWRRYGRAALGSVGQEAYLTGNGVALGFRACASPGAQCRLQGRRRGRLALGYYRPEARRC